MQYLLCVKALCHILHCYLIYSFQWAIEPLQSSPRNQNCPQVLPVWGYRWCSVNTNTQTAMALSPPCVTATLTVAPYGCLMWLENKATSIPALWFQYWWDQHQCFGNAFSKFSWQAELPWVGSYPWIPQHKSEFGIIGTMRWCERVLGIQGKGWLYIRLCAALHMDLKLHSLYHYYTHTPNSHLTNFCFFNFCSSLLFPLGLKTNPQSMWRVRETMPLHNLHIPHPFLSGITAHSSPPIPLSWETLIHISSWQ